MSMLGKQIEELRVLGRQFEITPYWAFEDDLKNIADEIEREIAERYMPLPVDADGVPIRVGDIMESDAFGRIEVEGFIHGAVAFWSYDPQPARLATCPVDLCRHAKPRTLEDVLRDVWKEALDYTKSDMWRNPDEVFMERADEIRELMKEDGRYAGRR